MELTRSLSYKLPLLRGEDVRAVQKALMSLNIAPPCGSADGVYGQGTQKSVAGFQAWQNARTPGSPPLDVDGKVGPATWRALVQAAKDAGSTSKPVVAAAEALAAPVEGVAVKGLPVTEGQAGRVKQWLRANYGAQIDAAVASADLRTEPEFDSDTVCAIACKETAIKWVGWIGKHDPDVILKACVFDASGDWPGTSRSAFPRNTAIFRQRHPQLAEELIAEANASRALQNWGRKEIVYKGYGLFQYDLQNIEQDFSFFNDKKWHRMEDCLDKLISILRDKRQAAGSSSLRETLRRYNGSGPRAESYADQVMALRAICKRTEA